MRKVRLCSFSLNWLSASLHHHIRTTHAHAIQGEWTENGTLPGPNIRAPERYCSAVMDSRRPQRSNRERETRVPFVIRTNGAVMTPGEKKAGYGDEHSPRKTVPIFCEIASRDRSI